MSTDNESAAGQPQEPQPPVIHYLKYGKSGCRIAEEHGAPFMWPAGNIWSQLWKDVTCEECLKHKPADGGA